MIKVTFSYEPEKPDPDSPLGIAPDEYEDLFYGVMALAAKDIEMKLGYSE